MRPFPIIAAALSLSAAQLLRGAVPEAAPSSYQPVAIIQTVSPVFPALETHLSQGFARVRIAVDQAGHLTDYLVVADTRNWFADSAVAALKQWKFQPGVRDGQPVPATLELNFNFERHGQSVVQETTAENLVKTFHDLQPAYRTYSLAELDGPPAPVRMAPPNLTGTMKAKGLSGTVVLDYYVDETGRVRMPVATNDAPPELAELAVAAVRQWLFRPPTHAGHPVLTRVSQTFHFNAQRG